MRTLRFFFLISSYLLLVVTHAKGAEFSLASPFTDHMVLQRDLSVPVWGTAKPGAKVTVNFAGQKKSAVANEAGKWKLVLGSLEGSAKGADFSAKTDQGGDIQLSDVVVGEV